MNIRLIAFDLDGTLLDDRKNLPSENLDALQAAAAALADEYEKKCSRESGDLQGALQRRRAALKNKQDQ